jgi:hypothetical protein
MPAARSTKGISNSVTFSTASSSSRFSRIPNQGQSRPLSRKELTRERELALERQALNTAGISGCLAVLYVLTLFYFVGLGKESQQALAEIQGQHAIPEDVNTTAGFMDPNQDEEMEWESLEESAGGDSAFVHDARDILGSR